MKKKSLLVLVLLTLSLIIVGCKKETSTTINPFWDSDQNGIADWQEKECNLTYATWQWHEGETTIDTLLIDQFMAKYPNVHITMQYVSEFDQWDTTLQGLAETGNLPDVMLINRLETTVPYNMLSDISEYYKNDSDTSAIFTSLQQNGVYDNVRYAVPSFVYGKWWFVNLDILENAGIQAPDYDWTIDQMETIAKACYNESTHTVGQSGYVQYWQELPKAFSNDASWSSFTYNTKTGLFNFDSDAFNESMERMSAALSSNATTSPYSVDEIKQYYGLTVTDYQIENGYNIGFDGHAAIWSSPSWVAKDYFKNMTFNWDVYPAPRTTDGANTIGGNCDLIGISSTCQNVGAAYALLKWMSYSEEGLVTRFKDYKEYSSSLYISADNYPYPVADYGIDKDGVNQIWDNLPYTKVKGMTSSQMINALKNGAFVLNKETPGWDSVDKVVNPYLYQIANGETTYQAVKATITSESNRVFKEFNDAMKAQIADNNK